jgi:predicted MFS family arabinose efflux permease
VLYLASAIAQPAAGRVAGLVGPRRVFLAGIVLVLAGGLVGGLGSSLAPLLVARVLIGVGTSCANPTAMVLVRRRAREAGLDHPPGGVIGGLQVAGVATASLGLPVGGLLVELFGWRAVFLVDVPVALVALAATLAWIPRDDPVARPDRGTRRERGRRAPLLGGVAHRRPLTRTFLRFGAVMLCSYLVLYGIAQWLQDARGLSAAWTGLLLLPMTLVSGLVTVPVSRRNLLRTPLVLAAAACVVAGAGVLLLPGPAWLPATVAVTLVLGLAQGAGGSSNTLAVYVQAADDDLGLASGLLRSFGYAGSIGASLVIGIVFRDRADDAGVVVIGGVMVVVALALLVLTLRDRRLPRVAQ